MAGFPSQFSVAMLPARTPAGRAPTAIAPPHVFGRKPACRWFTRANLLASSGSILHPISPAAPGTFGTCGVGTVRGPGLRTANLSLQKEFPLSDFRRVEFRAEFFNVTNTAILNAPSTWIYSNLGLINSSQGERNIQFALKFYF